MNGRLVFKQLGGLESRYLYLLLITGVFYWALHVQVTFAPTSAFVHQELPVIGVKVNQEVVRASAPTVIGFIILASLGTFQALKHAMRSSVTA